MISCGCDAHVTDGRFDRLADLSTIQECRQRKAVVRPAATENGADGLGPSHQLSSAAIGRSKRSMSLQSGRVDGAMA
jgi:hypothetical protein